MGKGLYHNKVGSTAGGRSYKLCLVLSISTPNRAE